MSRFFHNAVRSFTSLFGFVLDLMGDGLMCLPQQPPAHGRHFSVSDCKVAAQAILGGLDHEYRWERSAA